MGQSQEQSTPLSLRARNISINSENAIHNDEGARALGYAGGLVSGVTVYGYMVQLVVNRFGAAWLERNATRVTFFKPVYDGDPLTIRAETPVEDGGRRMIVAAAKADGEHVARMETEMCSTAPGRDSLAHRDASPADGERPPFDWEAVVVGKPFRPLKWTPIEGENRKWCESVMDDSPIYGSETPAPLHPSWILQQANNAISHQFRMNPWIHVSSRIVTRRVLRAGEDVTIEAVPLEKWEKRGNRYALLGVTISASGEPVLDIRHKAILQVVKPE